MTTALAGESGTLLERDYLGRDSLTAYAPLSVDGLNWVIVAQETSAEALVPVEDFTRNLILSTAGMIIFVCLLSLVLAQIFVRPLRRLKTAAQRIAAGEEGVQVDAGSSDELADVATAFNDMSRSLEIKSHLIDEQERANERLILSFMPEGMASRYKHGDDTITQDSDDVTVIFADIVGFEELALSMTSEEAIARLNDLVRTFDEAAERHGVERVRTTRQSYLASCGLGDAPGRQRAPRGRVRARARDDPRALLDAAGRRARPSRRPRLGQGHERAHRPRAGRLRHVGGCREPRVPRAGRLHRAGHLHHPARRRPAPRVGVACIRSGEVETQSGTQRVWKVEAPVAVVEG